MAYEDKLRHYSSRRQAVDIKVPEGLKLLQGKNVCFAIPTRGNDIYFGQVKYLLQQFRLFKAPVLFYGVNGHMCAIEAMMQILAKRKWDYVHFMDADIAPAPLTTLQLMARGKDLITAPVWMYDPDTFDLHLNYHDKREGGVLLRKHAPKPNQGLEEIVSTSMASLLISRRVFDAFVEADESFTEWTPFIDEELRYLPADVRFFAKVKKFGFKLYIDWDIPFATHHKLVGLCAETMDYMCVARAHEVLEMRKQGVPV